MLTNLSRVYSLGVVAGFLGILLLGGADVAHAAATTAPTTAASVVAAEQISLLWSIPFVALLACIALMPFIHKHWWEKYYPAVAVALGAIAAYYYFALAASPGRWIEEMESYISFIVLLGSLFVVSGGIVIHVNRQATPLANCVMLALGAVAANFFGTTGASMLLIRPYLRMNKGHIKPFHVVFFIFAVSNAGGLLTPIGDPPLFLGYLSGVPFWWVLKQCQWLWLVTIGILLVIFFILDTIEHGRNSRHNPQDPGPAVTIQGIHNLLFIAVIVWSVFQPGLFDLIRLMHDKGVKPELLFRLLACREVLMVAAGVGSSLFTGTAIYRQNEFNYAPIKEVAILFIGIFSTMVPALQWLNVNAHELPINTPGQFYFTSGALSSVLDNAPTYLTFLEAQLGKLDQAKVDQAVTELKRLGESATIPDLDKTLDESVQRAVLAAVQYHPNEVRNRELTRQQVEVSFLLGDPRLSLYLIAISAGSVLFGACTYIGNGPNFMVKSIADAWGLKTPSFIGYILCYSLPVLLPTYILIWLLFLYH